MTTCMRDSGWALASPMVLWECWLPGPLGTYLGAAFMCAWAGPPCAWAGPPCAGAGPPLPQSLALSTTADKD